MQISKQNKRQYLNKCFIKTGVYQVLVFRFFSRFWDSYVTLLSNTQDPTSVLGGREKSENKLNGEQLNLSFSICASVQGEKKLSFRTYTVIREGTSPVKFGKEARCLLFQLKMTNFYCNAAMFSFIPVAPQICSCIKMTDLRHILVFSPQSRGKRCSSQKSKEAQFNLITKYFN